MDRSAKKCIKASLKLTNSVMAFTGIAILMYSVWMMAVCLRDYQMYSLPWFLWACIGTGIIFSFIACTGHAGANTRSNFLLSLYILFMFLLILVESLITADIFLNDDWDKDFPKDHTKRFDDFVDYVDSNSDNFRCLALLIAFSQGLSFLLAMILRAMAYSHRNNEDEEARLPFLNHQNHHPGPYAVGHPDPSYYPAAPYAHTHGYAVDVARNEKAGEYVAAPYGHTHGYAADMTVNEKLEYIAPSAVQTNPKGHFM